MKSKKNLNTVILFVSLFLALSTSSCKKQCKDPSNPECPNYDPCFGKSDVSADFDVLSEIAISKPEAWLTVKADTTQLSTWLTFKAKDPSYKSYEWSVGTDIRRWKESAFTLSFGFTEAQKIPITLIVEGDPNKNCTEKKDWRDTITKEVSFIDYSDFVIFGEYWGSLTNNPTEEFSVKIKARQVNDMNQKNYISGLPFTHQEKIEYFFDTVITINGTSNNIITFSTNHLNSPTGIATLNTETNEITIEYNRIEPYPAVEGVSRETWPRKTYIFKGVKIK